MGRRSFRRENPYWLNVASLTHSKFAEIAATVVGISASTLEKSWRILIQYVTPVVNWVANSLLSLQPAKCCYMVISRKRCLRLHPPPILVNNSPLVLVNNVKYLDIQINSDLCWSAHVTSLCNKARCLIGLLYQRFYKHATSSTLLQLYKSFIRLHLEYWSVVWNPYLVCDIEALEKVQICFKSLFKELVTGA